MSPLKNSLSQYNLKHSIIVDSRLLFGNGKLITQYGSGFAYSISLFFETTTLYTVHRHLFNLAATNISNMPARHLSAFEQRQQLEFARHDRTHAEPQRRQGCRTHVQVWHAQQRCRGRRPSEEIDRVPRQL